jgi:FtsH-binding integral membrane protein
VGGLIEEAAMNGDNNTLNRRNLPVTSRLHPRVYVMMACLALWLALSVWFFAGAGVTDYLLVIVCGFVFIAVALPFIMSRVARGDGATGAATPSYHDWAHSDFDTWQGRLSGSSAAVQILLPIAAVAFGMTIFGITLHFATQGLT